MVRVKFCGLSREQDIEVVNWLMPEYAGFVFWEKSKRFVGRDKAERLREMLKPGILAVGVFLDETVQNVAEILNSGIIDIAQLHGHEDEQFISELKSLSDKPVIKAFNISDDHVSDAPVLDASAGNGATGNNANLSNIKAINACSADYVLLDSKVAGSGNTFDWRFVKGIERPYFLAGGLNLSNIAEALKINPYAVDVSSGIETAGVKDADKMRQFMQIVRNNI